METNPVTPRYKLPPLQDAREHEAFIKLLIEENVRSYLEIGAMYGASLWKVADVFVERLANSCYRSHDRSAKRS